MFQGHQLYIDSFYSSPQLFHDFDIRATGTVNMTRKKLPDTVKELHSALSRSDVPRGTGHYYRIKGPLDETHANGRDDYVMKRNLFFGLQLGYLSVEHY